MWGFIGAARWALGGGEGRGRGSCLMSGVFKGRERVLFVKWRELGSEFRTRTAIQTNSSGFSLHSTRLVSDPYN